MKTQTYENLIDGIINLYKITVMILMIWCCMFFVSWGIVEGIDKVVTIIEIKYSLLWHIFPISCLISIPLAMFMFYYQVAKKEYSITRLRDFWLGFSTGVKIPKSVSENNEKEISAWINQNIYHMHQQRIDQFFFASKNDAVAFKLRWTE